VPAIRYRPAITTEATALQARNGERILQVVIPARRLLVGMVGVDHGLLLDAPLTHRVAPRSPCRHSSSLSLLTRYRCRQRPSSRTLRFTRATALRDPASRQVGQIGHNRGDRHPRATPAQHVVEHRPVGT
jgi:hypothetical protein